MSVLLGRGGGRGLRLRCCRTSDASRLVGGIGGPCCGGDVSVQQSIQLQRLEQFKAGPGAATHSIFLAKRSKAVRVAESSCPVTATELSPQAMQAACM